MGTVLDPVDQTMFDAGRAIGATSLVQCVWVYKRPVDIDGLRQFHDHFQRGRLARRIERSPLPFGRHRWISPDGSSDMEIVGRPDRVKNNLGVVNPATSRPDGTDADYFAMKNVYRGMTKAMMYRFRRTAGCGLGKSARTGLCLGHCLSAGLS